ncbi:MAG TPA: GldG family protein [Clostridiaceae bacterium]|nr:GldG family protein [Clostridiaceae bacterium]
MDKIINAIKGFFKNKNFKYGTNSIILVAIVVAIAVVVNLIVGMTDLKLDLTPNKLYSITDTTRDILKNLEKDVVIYGLFDDSKIGSSGEYKDVTDLLSHYDKYDHVTVKYVDPDKNPGIMKELDSEKLNDVRKNDFVVKCGNKVKKLSYYDLFNVQLDQYSFSTVITGSVAEQSFTGAIKYVTSDITPTVYFTEGHDENKVDEGLQTLKQYLEMNNYDIKVINLLAVEAVPEDAEILMFASPKSDLSEDEMVKLKDYLDNGGNAVFLFDPLNNDPDLVNFDKILSEYNISLNYDRVKENDDSRYVPGNQYDIIPDVQTNSIVSQEFVMIMPKSRSINQLKNTKDYITVTPLLKTSDKAVGEMIDKTRGDDLNGPLDIAVAVEDKGGLSVSKILVFGNSSFITDTAIQRYGAYSQNGMYLFLMSLNWMHDAQNDVVIAPKSYETPVMKITAQQSLLMGILVIGVLPLIVIVTGVVVYLRRRHL